MNSWRAEPTNFASRTSSESSKCSKKDKHSHRRLDGPEVLPALPDDRDAPASQLGGGGLFFLHRSGTQTLDPIGSIRAARTMTKIVKNSHRGSMRTKKPALG
jgi:hypothetical protein